MKLKSFLFVIPLSFVMCFSSCSSDTSSITTSSSSTVETTYKNPVWEPVCPDPSIVKGDNGKYYIYCTEETADWGAQGYGKLVVPILESSDLVHWECVGSAFTISTMPLWNDPADQIWAPDVVKIGDKYIMTYSLTHWSSKKDAIGIATSDNPIGPWTDQGKLMDADGLGGYNCIDSCMFVDDDNRVYLYWGSFAGIWGIEMSSDGLSIKPGAEKVLLCGGASTTSTNTNDYEGSFVRKINGEYIIFLSTGTCCNGFNSTYKVVAAKSSSPLGPFVDESGNAMLKTLKVGTEVVHASNRFVGVGHNAVIQDNKGDWYIIYHGYDRTQPEVIGTCNRRCLLIDRLEFDENNFPHTHDKIPSETAIKPVI